ncbi:MAG: NADH-quinone oxidoreductase subunit J family protein, partial [Vicinamibacteria bacterium]
RSLYSAAICFLGVVCSSAAFLFLSGAELLALLQVLIYAGAVMVLIVITIMASNREPPERWSRLLVPRPLALLVLIAPAAVVVVLAFSSLASTPGAGAAPELVAARARVGSVLFGTHAVATEAVTLLMFFAALALDRGSGRG